MRIPSRLFGLVVLSLACANPGGTVPEPEVPAVVAPEVAPEPVVAAPTVELVVSRDPAWVVAKLVEVERGIRDPDVDDPTAAAYGHLQQRIYRLLAEDPVFAAAVVAKVPPELAKTVETVLHGTREIGRTVVKPRTDLPDWRIVEARPAAELIGYYREAEARHGVPWTVLAAIHLNETRMGRLRGLSDVGAKGPMQFMPETWSAYGAGDVENDRDAIFAAANYLAAMGWATDRRKAIWAYNNTERYVNAILDFSEVMAADEHAYRGFWGWQVYYRTVEGAVWLSPGYEAPERMSIAAWCGSRGEPYCPKVHGQGAPSGGQ